MCVLLFLRIIHLDSRNQNFQADPGATMTFVAGGALKPIGGHILSHASATRIFLRKGQNTEMLSNVI
jgi:meiotic recombination protein DMC1